MVLGLCRQGSKLPTHSLPPKGALARAQARSRNRIRHSAICVRRLPTNQLVQRRVSGVDNLETHAPKDQMLRQPKPTRQLGEPPGRFQQQGRMPRCSHSRPGCRRGSFIQQRKRVRPHSALAVYGYPVNAVTTEAYERQRLEDRRMDFVAHSSAPLNYLPDKGDVPCSAILASLPYFSHRSS
jgi:hypothetical protein